MLKGSLMSKAQLYEEVRGPSGGPSSRPRLSRSGLAASLLTISFMVVLTAFSVQQEHPPAVVSANAQATDFSSSRAMRHLEVIAEKTHPIGSPEHAVVRDYIIGVLRAEGLDPEVQTVTAVNQTSDNTVRAGTVRNIVARLKGVDNSKAILLAGHYDSRSSSYGASDDGAAIVAMLETLRALKAGPPLKNDVIFLFTDGEEVALLGARAFVEEHPYAKDVGLALNFEARGNGGPSIMFETSDHNGWLIKQFSEASPYPVANSLAYEIYRLLPNDTDFTVFKKAGIPGLNFAYIKGLTNYHTLLDSFDKIDERSLQHHGYYALGLTRHFGNLNLDTGKESNAVYFDIFGKALIHYSNAWIIPLTVFVAASFIVVAWLGFRKQRLTLLGSVAGAFAFLISMTVTIVLVTYSWKLIRSLNGDLLSTPESLTYNSDYYLLGFSMLALAISGSLYTLFLKKIRLDNLIIGGLFWWLVLTILAAFYLPGASYLFTWPLLFSLLGVALLWRSRENQSISIKLCAVLCLCAIPAIVMLVPMIHQVFIGLTVGLVGAIMALVVLLFGLLIPHFSFIAAPNKWLAPGALAITGLALVLITAASFRFTSDHPKQDSIFYVLNADTGKASWASDDQKADEWTSQFLSVNASRATLPELFSSESRLMFLRSDAPTAPITGPEIQVLEDSTSNETRSLRARITSSRRAEIISLYIDSGAEVEEAWINGKQISNTAAAASGARRDRWALRYYAIPDEGIELTWRLKSFGPLKLRAVDQSYGLPEIQGASFTLRPNHIIPSSMALSDSTLVSKTFTF
jgi:hypothetical protein